MVSALTRKFLEDLRIGLGASGIFPEKKPGNVPEPPEPLLLLFADENHYSGNVSEQAQNNSRGCRKCSRTFRNFSEEIVTENILSQREGTRSHGSWGLFLACWGGPPPRVGGQGWPAMVVSSMGTHLPHLCGLHVGHVAWGILVFPHPPHPLPWPINRRCVGCHFSSILSNTCHWTCLASLSLPAKEFCRAERLSSFRQGLVLDGEALLDS